MYIPLQYRLLLCISNDNSITMHYIVAFNFTNDIVQQQPVLRSTSPALVWHFKSLPCLNLLYFRYQPPILFALSTSLSFIAAQAAAWSLLILTHCLLRDELQHENFLQVAMGTLLFNLPAPLASLHIQCSPSDVIFPWCWQMLYSDDFLLLFESAPSQVYLSNIGFFFFFLSFLNPFKKFWLWFFKWSLQNPTMDASGIFNKAWTQQEKSSYQDFSCYNFPLCFTKTVCQVKNTLFIWEQEASTILERNGVNSKCKKEKHLV